MVQSKYGDGPRGAPKPDRSVRATWFSSLSIFLSCNLPGSFSAVYSSQMLDKAFRPARMLAGSRRIAVTHVAPMFAGYRPSSNATLENAKQVRAYPTAAIV